MLRIFKKLFFLIPVLAGVILIHCSGGGDSDSQDEVVQPTNPSISHSDDLSSSAVNTFLDNGIQLTIDPTYADLGETTQDEPLKTSFTITNGTSDSQLITLSLFGSSGVFRMMKDNGEFFAYLPDVSLAAGESQTLTLVYDASLMGTHTGYLEITAYNVSGTIYFPFRGSVTGPADFRIISSGYMCTNDNAPQLTSLDFMKVASDRSKVLSFKICNTGGERLKINTIEFGKETDGVSSMAMDVDPFQDFEWEVTDALNTAYFEYYNPPTDSSFIEPEYIDYTGALPDATAAFEVEEHTYEINPDGLVIDSGSYAVFDVTFAPELDAEAPEGQLYNPVSYAADMKISTSLGELEIDLVGATGGKEPILEVSYIKEDDSATTYEVDLDSQGAAIHFGTASIFDDWITEDTKEVTLTLANMGSGLKSLQIWADSIDLGYFTFVRESPERSFPIELDPGVATTIKLVYAPTPEGNVAQDTYDMGQMVLRHTAGNGPVNPVTFVGEEESGEIIDIQQAGGVKLKKNDAGADGSNPYDSAPKRFCISQGDDASWSTISFEIANHSSLADNILTTGWSIALDPQEGTGQSSGIVTPVGDNPVQTGPGETGTFGFIVTPATDEEGDILSTINGTLMITNSFALEETLGVSLDYDYEVNFTMTVASTADGCSGGSGQPLTGTRKLVIDAITMNMPSGAITEPATNRSPFKFHLPIDLDSTNGYARIHGLDYSTEAGVSPVTQIRSYAHQLTGAYLGCRPYPTNPYRLEFEEGSWDGPFQCPYEEDPNFGVKDGTVTCMDSNGAEDYVVDETTTYKVFYHEFIQFNEDCTVKFKGKFAYFYLKPGETVKDAVQRIIDEYGVSAKDYEYETGRGAFQFDSYITFNEPYTCNGVTQSGTVTDPDAIKLCWMQFHDDQVSRLSGFIDECNYFNFSIDEGCIPRDAPGSINYTEEELCDDGSITYDDPDTWVGFGEYEPREDDETKWDLTLRNIHIQAFVLHANEFFKNNSKMLFSDLYVTLTTRAIGENSDDPQDLIAVNSRSDFSTDRIYIPKSSDMAQDYWIQHGKNSKFFTGEEQYVDCDPSQPLTSCRGNFVYNTGGNEILHSGEPIDFVTDGENRTILVGVGSFHGKDQMAPFFAQELKDGRGSALYFTFHGCFEADDADTITEGAGCFAPQLDPGTDDDGASISSLFPDYVEHTILADTDIDSTDVESSKAYINYHIFDFDRDRATDYYSGGSLGHPNGNYYVDEDYYNDNSCGGYGH